MFLMVKQLGLLNTHLVADPAGHLRRLQLRGDALLLHEHPCRADRGRPDRRRQRLQILRKIVLPLSKAVIAVVGLFYAVGFWNAFFNAMLYINDQTLYPVQLVLRNFVVQGGSMAERSV